MTTGNRYRDDSLLTRDFVDARGALCSNDRYEPREYLNRLRYVRRYFVKCLVELIIKKEPEQIITRCNQCLLFYLFIGISLKRNVRHIK